MESTFCTDITHLMQQPKKQPRQLPIPSNSSQDHDMYEEEEEDLWIRQDTKQPVVTLLKPQVVKFVVQPSNPEEFSKAILPEDPEEDKEEGQFQIPSKKSKEQTTYDDLLYHPCEDELNQSWALNNLGAKKPAGHCQLSCSKCFTALTYQGEPLKNQRKLGDYQADVATVQNVIIDQSQIVVNPQYKIAEERFEMILFKGRCKYCDEIIATYDIESKIVYFRNVVPNFIG